MLKRTVQGTRDEHLPIQSALNIVRTLLKATGRQRSAIETVLNEATPGSSKSVSPSANPPPYVRGRSQPMSPRPRHGLGPFYFQFSNEQGGAQRHHKGPEHCQQGRGNEEREESQRRRA